MAIPLLIMGAIAAAKGISGGIQAANAKSDMETLKKNRPRFTIASEAYENKAIGQQAAFGKSRAISAQEENIAQSGANNIHAAQQSSANSGSILGTLALMRGQQATDYRNLAGDEAGIQMQGKQMLMGANNNLSSERKTAFDYNVNQPYQNAIAEARDKQAKGKEQMWSGIDGLGGAFGGGMKGGMLGK